MRWKDRYTHFSISYIKFLNIKMYEMFENMRDIPLKRRQSLRCVHGRKAGSRRAENS